MQVGRRMHVQITRVDESTNNLILSEREAWVGIRISLFPFIKNKIFNSSISLLRLLFLPSFYLLSLLYDFAGKAVSSGGNTS